MALNRLLNTKSISVPNNRSFHVSPESLLRVSMYSSGGINKLDGVVHRYMCVAGCSQGVVGCPLVRVNDAPRENPAVYQREECCTISAVVRAGKQAALVFLSTAPRTHCPSR